MKRWLLLAVAAMMVCLPSLALANTETFDASGGIATTKTDWTNPLSFQQFDSSLGTLNKVTISLNSVLDTNMTVFNSGSAPASGSFQTLVQISVKGGAIFPSTTPWMTEKIPTSPWTFNLAAGEGASLGPIHTESGNVANSYTSGLGDFIGLGNFGLECSTLTSYVTAGSFTFGQNTTADLHGIITYDYTPKASAVPVPPSLLLLGSGLLGLLALRRRQKKYEV